MVWIPQRLNGGDFLRKGDAGAADPSRGAEEASCADPVGRSLLVPYALSECTEDQALDFEAHLLGCDACFGDLKCLDRAGSLIREHLPHVPAARAPGSLRSAGRGVHEHHVEQPKEPA